MSMLYVDAHCHLHEYSTSQIAGFSGIIIVAVSDDYESSLKTLEISEKLSNVIPCVGIHPWNIDEKSINTIGKVLSLASEAKCIGEVGLDRRFKPETYHIQLEVFRKIVNIAREYGLPLNIHAAGAWREVFSMVYRSDIDRVLFHWYNGPIDLLREIMDVDYLISINPSIKIQRKHMKILEEVEVKNLLTESDGPYSYHGLNLNPLMVKELIKYVAEVKNTSEDHVASIVLNNLYKFVK